MGTFDDVLEQIGQLGRYQILIFLYLCSTFISTGWHTVSIVFIGANRDHWCAVPGLENFTEMQRRNIVEPTYCGPQVKEDVCRQCFMNVLDFNPVNITSFSSLEPEALNYTGGIEKCTAWEYGTEDFTSTLVSKFNLVCDREWLVSMLQTIYMAGYLIGCLFFGSISDRFGRMNALMTALVAEIVVAVAEIYIPNFFIFAMFRFFLGASAGAVYTCAYVCVLELIGPRYRAVVGIFAQWGFDVGVLLCIAVGYTVKDHVMMQWIYALPPVIFLGSKFIFPESPRWLVSKGRLSQAEVILRKVGNVNGRKFPDEVHLEALIDKEHCQDEGESNSALDLLRTPTLRKRSIISFYVWFSASAVYYGLMLGDRGFGFSIYANVAQSGAAAILAYFVCPLVYNKIGRRLGIMIMLVSAGVILFACIPLIPLSHLFPLLFTLSFIGKIANCSGFHGVYLHTSEFYPTVIRNIGVGCGSMFARLGGLVAPQVARLAMIWQPLPAIILGVIAVTAGLSNLLLPETLNKKLPETIEDGENFATKREKENGHDDAAMSSIRNKKV